MNTKINCPICNDIAVLSSSNLFRPFCSERCRLIDLGKWVDEKYSINDATTSDYDQAYSETDNS
jgi:uncharacterized protein